MAASVRSGPKWSSSTIRRCFVDYFVTKHDHKWIPSSSVMPQNDPTLLYTSAGMNQFRDIFTGTISADNPFAQLRRAVSYQKCIRMGGKHDDLEMVGFNFRHHTFFEMLGNWSFGDYFKEDACRMATDLILNVFKIPQERLIVTYFGGDKELSISSDEETKEIWYSLGFPPKSVVPLGSKDNFWEMGFTGPCGICSEIHYQLEPPSNHKDPMENCLEIWNLVFIQYNRMKDGNLTHLPRNHVDTGMGLERIASVVNNVFSNYDTDLFQPLMELLQKETKAPPYCGSLDDPLDIAYRIVSDHIRMIAISLVDGLQPATRDAGRHFRKIFRRCYFYLVDDFRSENPTEIIKSLAKKFTELMGDDYSEISERIDNVCEIIEQEACLVNEVIRKSRKKMQRLASELKKDQVTTVNGKHALSLFVGHIGSKSFLNRLASEEGLTIDWNDFEKYFAEHKEKSAAGMEKSKAQKANLS